MTQTQTVEIHRIWSEGDDVRCFDLRPQRGSLLPPYEPGSHIEVSLPGNLRRHYSLLNGPSDTHRYVIGVKRQPEGRGGSLAMHSLQPGEQLIISAPRNSFPMLQGDGPAILLAGGIGITPLLSMARHRKLRQQPTRLHYFTRPECQVPFVSQITTLPDATLELRKREDVPNRLREILLGPASNAHIYMCGPGPFMDLVKQIAKEIGWRDDQIHFELFTVNGSALDLSGDEFEVVLKRSGHTLRIGGDTTIVEAMMKEGLQPLTSCEMGICGTCKTKVLEGEPDHRDRYLSESEKSAADVMMICVSRCKGKRLVLDI